MHSNPHQKQPIVAAGASLAGAAGAIILLHGRGGSAEDILGLGQIITPPGWAMLAPQAADNTWYPYSFLVPREHNEPYLTSALEKVESAREAARGQGVADERIVFAGFSQGACLATEYVGRNPRRYGALLAFTGGLIGPIEAQLNLAGNLDGTPVLLSSGDPDPHVPWKRVEQSGELLQAIGGRITINRYPGRPHTINAEEVSHARQLLASL